MVITLSEWPTYTYKNASKKKKFKKKEKPNTNGNRGMRFEEAINESNEYYLARQIAVIHKKPTPIQIVKVDYPRRSAAVIKEAYFTQASTTDYNGVYRGNISTLKQKKRRTKLLFPLKTFMRIKSSIWKLVWNKMGFVLSYYGFHL